MNEPKPRYWFHAKRYGWGWGLPASWQGWVVFITWLVLVLTISPWLAVRSMAWFFVFVITMAAALIAICWFKGEPPRWRWGRVRSASRVSKPFHSLLTLRAASQDQLTMLWA